MCIAIYKPEGIEIPQETLERCYRVNSDGAGYMFHKNGKLYVKKGFFSFDDFWRSYKKDKRKEAVIHFRIKTHGVINEENCHPYKVNDDLAFVHNGIISGYSDTHKSDTWLFNEDIVQPFVRKWGNLEIFEDPIKKLIENRIGYSKLIFMDNHGNTKIFNEDKGEWFEGVWYSNTGYKKPAPLPPPTKYDSYGKQTSKYDKYKQQTWSYKKDTIKVGDLVILNKPMYDPNKKINYKEDTFWEVAAVNNDYTVDLVEDEAVGLAGWLYNVPFYNVDIYQYTPYGSDGYGGYTGDWNDY